MEKALDRIEKRLTAAGLDCARVTIKAGGYADGSGTDYAERAPAILASVDAETMENPYQYSRIIDAAHNIGKQYRKTISYYYSRGFARYNFTFAAAEDMKRLDAAQAEANVFLEAYWQHQHEHGTGARIDPEQTPAAIEAGKKALAQYRAERQEARTA